MSNIKHPFKDYPFKGQILDPEIKELIKTLDFYHTAQRIEEVINRKSLTDANTNLCLAYFIWMDAMAIEADVDVIDFGKQALAIINQILEQEQTYKPALKLKTYIEREVKSAQKAQMKMEKFAKIPFELLTLEQAKDFAYFLGDHKKDKASKELEYKLWNKLYHEAPDVIVHQDKDMPELKLAFHGNRLFNLIRMAIILWDDLEKTEDARTLLWQLINWPSRKDLHLYHHGLTFSIKSLCMEAIVNHNSKEFKNLITMWREKYDQINSYGVETMLRTPNLPLTDAGLLLKYALEINDLPTLIHIKALLFDQNDQVIKNQSIKDDLKKATLLMTNQV